MANDKYCKNFVLAFGILPKEKARKLAEEYDLCVIHAENVNTKEQGKFLQHLLDKSPLWKNYLKRKGKLKEG